MIEVLPMMAVCCVLTGIRFFFDGAIIISSFDGEFTVKYLRVKTPHKIFDLETY